MKPLPSQHVHWNHVALYKQVFLWMKHRHFHPLPCCEHEAAHALWI